MESKHNKKLVNNARALRKNMTKDELHLWLDFLRTHPAKFTRQKIIGRYIVDFYCAAAKIAIELDGSQHYEDNGLKRDCERTQYLEQFGITVIRIPNNEIHSNFSGVCEYIDSLVRPFSAKTT